MTKEEALTKALNQLKRADQIIQSLCPQGYIHPALCSIHGAIVNVQEALAQPEQEPVISKWVLREVYFDEDGEPISHRSPPQRKPLTDEEMKKIWYAMQNIMGWYSFQEIARAIEAAHGIKE